MTHRTAAAVVLGLVGVGSTPLPQTARGDVLAQVDHIIYATPDLDRTVEALERQLGVRATPAGSSPGRGTHSALLSLGAGAYLEIVAPDPGQARPSQPPWWMPGLHEPRIVQWAAKGMHLESLRATAVSAGVPLGEVTSGRRMQPDGVWLTWRFTSPRRPVADGIVPFFIDWGHARHPARSAPPGVRLVGLRGEHPDTERVRRMLRQLGLALPVAHGDRPALIATLDGPLGRLELR